MNTVVIVLALLCLSGVTIAQYSSSAGYSGGQNGYVSNYRPSGYGGTGNSGYTGGQGYVNSGYSGFNPNYPGVPVSSGYVNSGYNNPNNVPYNPGSSGYGDFSGINRPFVNNGGYSG